MLKCAKCTHGAHFISAKSSVQLASPSISGESGQSFTVLWRNCPSNAHFEGCRPGIETQPMRYRWCTGVREHVQEEEEAKTRLQNKTGNRKRMKPLNKVELLICERVTLSTVWLSEQMYNERLEVSLSLPVGWFRWAVTGPAKSSAQCV